MKPTESEMEILQVLWNRGPSTVREVFENLNKKDVGYTTILKFMQILHEKNMVLRDTTSKTHVYVAAVNKEEIQGQFLSKMIDTVFNGSTSRLVMHALGNSNTSKEEIDLIKAYLENFSKK